MGRVNFILAPWRIGLLTDRTNTRRPGGHPSREGISANGCFKSPLERGGAWRRGASFALWCALALTAVAADPAAPAPLSFTHDVQPLLQNYCYDCHGDGMKKGGLALDAYQNAADLKAARAKWELVLHHVSRHEMPPDDGGALPTDSERDLLSRFVEQELFALDPAHPDPGRVVLRRLNRAEYNATIRDLVGVDFNPAADFPPDDSGYGFDNIGDVLSLPPVLLEKYLNAADRILDTAIVTEPVKSEVRRIPASLSEIGFNAVGDRGDGWIHLISLEEDDAAVELSLPAGDYLFRVHAFATRTGGALKGQGSEVPLVFDHDPGPTKLALMLNDAFIQDFTIGTDEAHPGTYETRIGVPAGKQRFRASVRRKRGGNENETFMLNGRLGQQQPGIVFVKWLEIEGPLHAATRRYPAGKLDAPAGAKLNPAGEYVLAHNGEVAVKVEVGAADWRRDHQSREAQGTQPESRGTDGPASSGADVILRAQAYADQAGSEPVHMEFRVDGQPVKTFDVLAPGTMQPLPKQRVFSLALLVPAPQVYEFKAKLAPGPHRFSAAFVNDFTDPQAENPNLRDRKLTVQNLEVANLAEPVLTPQKPELIEKLFASATDADPLNRLAGLLGLHAAPPESAAGARVILEKFTRRAWRRPVASAEIDRLMQLYTSVRQSGDSFEAAVKLAMKAVLVSPNFLFIGSSPVDGPRVKFASSSTVAGVANPGASHASAPIPRGGDPGYSSGPQPIDEYALASRLSYFLWSSMPDDELLDLADHGQLRANLPAQVRRLLASPKAHALVENFAGQWLQIRSLETFSPDKKLFPDYDPVLRNAMERETQLFFEHIMREDRSLFDFLTADYTFVNARLAKLYGLPGVTGEDFQQVSLEGTPRRGVLTQASVLTLTSNPTRTSPVKRGKWVLENLLGTPPPPPPPNIPDLDDKNRHLTGTLRQQLEQHRANATCASCHARMDPIGFGLENFNAIGAWRDKDGDAAIDSGGVLANGDKFANASELAKLLAEKRRWEFLHCLADRALIYALGRGTEYYDRPALDEIVKQVEARGDKFSALMLAVVESFPFQNRRSEQPTIHDVATK